MKLMKYTFRTPLFGSIDCEELLSDTDGRIELSPEQMCKLYDHGPELLTFLTENIEDLASCVPQELEDVIFRAEFGDCAMLGGKMWLNTHIYTRDHLTELGFDQVKEWITGQMSDGWGESLEQRSWKTRQVYKTTPYFDEYTLDFEDRDEFCRVDYYAHPWNPEEFEICFGDCEEVEEDISPEVVATMFLPYHSRQVLMLRGSFALEAFLKELGQDEFFETIRTGSSLPLKAVYLVQDMDGPSGVELLPKWASESSLVCHLNMLGAEGHTKYAMRRHQAIAELLK